MGHAVNYRSYPVDTDKKNILADINEECRYEGDYHTDLGSIIQYMDRTFSCREEAEEYLNSYAEGKFYWCGAVKYKKNPESKKAKELHESAKQARLDYYAQNGKLYADAVKSAYVGCSECGSKFNRQYLKTNHCPMCNHDFRSATMLAKLKRMDEKAEALFRKYREELKKPVKGAPEYWLVRYEYHV